MTQKNYFKTILLIFLSYCLAAANAQSEAGSVWVSDEIEAPLRAKPELNAKIVTLLPARKTRVKRQNRHPVASRAKSDGAGSKSRLR